MQAFDRDLPSRERLAGTGPQLLGEATTDAEGRFQITYTPGPGDIGAGVAGENSGADLSFRVFARGGQELTIARIEALQRTYRADQIIFNAPAALEVRLSLEAPAGTDASEFEQWTARIAPIVQDLPLTALQDDDMAFLIGELGLDQQPEVRDRIEWLRRSALLAQQTGVPAEAFYGWGRKDLPAPLVELAEARLQDLPKFASMLADLPAERLANGLAAALAENIIPATLRERIGEIVRQILRRNQVLHAVAAQLQDAETQAPLVGYSVTTIDQNADNEDRGLAITDRQGRFSFTLYAPRVPTPEESRRQFTFQIVSPQGEAVPLNTPIVVDLNRAESEIVVVPVPLPKPPPPLLTDQLRAAAVEVSERVQSWLQAKEIRTLADIRRKGGLKQFTDLPEMDPAVVRRVEALADLDRVSSDVGVSSALLALNYDSVLAIAERPSAEFIATVQAAQPELQPLQLAQMHVMATVQTNLLNNRLVEIALNAANGFPAEIA